MKFKVGDMVRLTRLALYNMSSSANEKEMFGGEVNRVYENGFCVVGGFKDEHFVESLELVPEESEIKHGDIIEVSDDGEHWVKRMFIAKTDNGDFIATDCIDKDHFINGWSYKIESYKYARKRKPQLTRKKIAEKFGIDKDFIFVDE